MEELDSLLDEIDERVEALQLWEEEGFDPKGIRKDVQARGLRLGLAKRISALEENGVDLSSVYSSPFGEIKVEDYVARIRERYLTGY